MATNQGEVRARILEAVLALVGSGLTLEAALEQLQSVHRATIHRWHKAVRGKPRDEWAVALQSRKLTEPADNHRSRLWRSMRMLRWFSYADLVVTAETSARNCSNYVSALVRTGYLRKEVLKVPGKAGRQRVRFTLIRDTGPHAPRVLHDRDAVWDANRKQLLEVPHAA